MVPAAPVTRASVATYDAYEHAQRAVDFLSDERFEVERVQIVGTDLRMVEQVVGRLTWGRAILSGAATGAWIGLFVGVLMSILVTDLGAGGAILTGLVNGVVFGAIFGAVSYALTGGRRDFVSRSRILPTRYDVLVEASHADRAREVLARLPAATT
ncbi:MAG: hypothetical protein M3P48_08065 [Actinomycetota bacterium]|nr:hypothetical protein [Actinomycetota bacterium]